MNGPIEDLLKKFPKLVKAILERVSTTNTREQDYVKRAREKLFAQLNKITNEISDLQNSDTNLTEEQIKNLLARKNEDNGGKKD